jgi:hypothetical protein
MEVTYLVYRITKRFMTPGFDTLEAYFEHRISEQYPVLDNAEPRIGSPIEEFTQSFILNHFSAEGPEIDELVRQGYIVNHGRYIFIKVKEKVIPPVIEFAVKLPIKSPQVYYALEEGMTFEPERECDVCGVCLQKITDFFNQVNTPKHFYHYGCYSVGRRQGDVVRDDKRDCTSRKSMSTCTKCSDYVKRSEGIFMEDIGIFHYDCFPLEPHPDALVVDLVTDDENDTPHATKRPRLDGAHRCPNCSGPVNDLENIHIHEGEIFHEACYLDRVRKSKMAAPPTYNPPTHDGDDARIDCPFPDCDKKPKTERTLLAHYKISHRDDEAYPEMCRQIAMARECPVCKAYHYGVLGLTQHMTHGCADHFE